MEPEATTRRADAARRALLSIDPYLEVALRLVALAHEHHLDPVPLADARAQLAVYVPYLERDLAIAGMARPALPDPPPDTATPWDLMRWAEERRSAALEAVHHWIAQQPEDGAGSVAAAVSSAITTAAAVNEAIAASVERRKGERRKVPRPAKAPTTNPWTLRPVEAPQRLSIGDVVVTTAADGSTFTAVVTGFEQDGLAVNRLYVAQDRRGAISPEGWAFEGPWAAVERTDVMICALSTVVGVCGAIREQDRRHLPDRITVRRNARPRPTVRGWPAPSPDDRTF